MRKKKDRRLRDRTSLWRGKVRKVIEQSSDGEIAVLARLMFHTKLTQHERYLVLEGAIFDVWGERLADREEEVKARRKRAREQRRTDSRADINEPASPPSES